MKKVIDTIVGLLKAFGEALLAAVFNGFQDLVKSVADNGGQLLLDAADEAVRAAEAAGGTGFEKYDAAFDAIGAKLASEGVAVVGNAVNGAIEAAVAKLKAEVAEINAGPDVSVQ